MATRAAIDIIRSGNSCKDIVLGLEEAAREAELVDPDLTGIVLSFVDATIHFVMTLCLYV
jgi:hypothetical protein